MADASVGSYFAQLYWEYDDWGVEICANIATNEVDSSVLFMLWWMFGSMRLDSQESYSFVYTGERD